MAIPVRARGRSRDRDERDVRETRDRQRGLQRTRHRLLRTDASYYDMICSIFVMPGISPSAWADNPGASSLCSASTLLVGAAALAPRRRRPAVAHTCRRSHVPSLCRRPVPSLRAVRSHAIAHMPSLRAVSHTPSLTRRRSRTVALCRRSRRRSRSRLHRPSLLCISCDIVVRTGCTGLYWCYAYA